MRPRSAFDDSTYILLFFREGFFQAIMLRKNVLTINGCNATRIFKMLLYETEIDCIDQQRRN